METNTNFNRGLIFNLLSVFLNSAAMTLSKFALKGIDSLMVTTIICMTSSILALTYIYTKKIRLSFEEFKLIYPIATINAIATILLYASISILDPVVVGIIGRFYVIFTTILSVIILQERPSRTEWVFIGLAILGTFLFVQKDTPQSTVHYLGVAMGLGYTLFFAVANLLVKKRIKKANSVTILLYNNLLGGLVSILILNINGSHVEVGSFLKQNFLVLSILTAIITFLGLVMFFNSFRFLSFKLSNLIRSTSPIFVALVSWPFFPLKLSVSNAAGGVLVFVSIIFLSLIEKGKA